MEIKKITGEFTVCKVLDLSEVEPSHEFYFISRTDEEISVVCRTEDVPQNTCCREDGWKACRIQGTLDFSLIGILAEISGILAKQKIGIFVISTYQTDYILTKAENYERAMLALEEAGYHIL